MARNIEHSTHEEGADDGNKDKSNKLDAAFSSLHDTLKRAMVNPEGGPDMEAVEAMDVELNKSLDEKGDLKLIMVCSHLLENAHVTYLAALQSLETSEEKAQALKEMLSVFKEYLHQLGMTLNSIGMRIEGFDDYMQMEHFDDSIRDFYRIVMKFLSVIEDKSFVNSVNHHFNTPLTMIAKASAIEEGSTAEKEIKELKTSLSSALRTPRIFDAIRWRLSEFVQKIEGKDYYKLRNELTPEEKEKVYAEFITPLCEKLGVSVDALKENKSVKTKFED